MPAVNFALVVIVERIETKAAVLFFANLSVQGHYLNKGVTGGQERRIPLEPGKGFGTHAFIVRAVATSWRGHRLPAAHETTPRRGDLKGGQAGPEEGQGEESACQLHGDGKDQIGLVKES